MKELLVGHLFGEARPSESVANLPLGAIVTEYLKQYAAGTSHTARAKQLDTDRFLEFLKRYRGASEIDALTVAAWDFSATQRFVDELLKIGEAPATVSRRLATLKHMGRVLAERIPGFVNPAREVKPPRPQTLRPQSITPSEVEQIKQLAASERCTKSSFNSTRNEMILKLLLDTGLRADEIRTMRLGQLDRPSLEWIRQVRTKGRRFRDVYVSTEARPALKEYLDARTTELKRFFPSLSPSIDAKLPLFISGHGAKASDLLSFELSPKSIWRIIRGYSVKTKLHPHLLRHTYAVDLLEDSKDIRLVAQALGHADVRITMRYTERSNEEVAAAREKLNRRKK
jgi:site-specific recombinase XerD